MEAVFRLPDTAVAGTDCEWQSIANKVSVD